ncbi:MAG: hypothetical protein IT424_03955 [Pirellulales bacterium]|nr:hypothetical protein [Pirellulales bacterium]
MERVEAVGRYQSSLSFASEVAWNLRERIREATQDRTLRTVLDEGLPSIRAKLEISLIDDGLANLASTLPSNEALSAASLIAWVQQASWPGGLHLLPPAGEPPRGFQWHTLARLRALRIASQLCDERGELMFDSQAEGELRRIEQLDAHFLAELFHACSQLSPLDPAFDQPKDGHAKTQFVPNTFQAAILAALEGRALTKEQLAGEVCGGEGSRLYRSGGIKELMECNPPRVLNKRRLGYYRPDAPPEGVGLS